MPASCDGVPWGDTIASDHLGHVVSDLERAQDEAVAVDQGHDDGRIRRGVDRVELGHDGLRQTFLRLRAPQASQCGAPFLQIACNWRSEFPTVLFG
jgi:hypothetical protein